jgi:hypothetical protein
MRDARDARITLTLLEQAKGRPGQGPGTRARRPHGRVGGTRGKACICESHSQRRSCASVAATAEATTQGTQSAKLVARGSVLKTVAGAPRQERGTRRLRLAERAQDGVVCCARSAARSCVPRQERGTCAAPGARHILGVRSAPSSGQKDRPEGTRNRFVTAQGEARRAERYVKQIGGETEEQQRSPTAAAAGRCRHAGQPPCPPARRTSVGASRPGV